MAKITLNKNTFTILLGIMVALIVVMVGILIVHFAAPGLIAGISGLFGGGDEPVIEEEEEGPWGEKVYSWTYQGVKYQTELSISKEAYKNANNPVGGYDLGLYIVDDDERTVRHLTSNLERIAKEHSLSDRETVDFVVSFVQGLTYAPDKTSGHPANYPRTPTVTLAEQTGDSKDLSILAALILDDMGYSAAVLNYPANNFGGTYVPGAAAIAVPGDSTANGPVYNITRKTVPEPFESSGLQTPQNSATRLLPTSSKNRKSSPPRTSGKEKTTKKSRNQRFRPQKSSASRTSNTSRMFPGTPGRKRCPRSMPENGMTPKSPGNPLPPGNSMNTCSRSSRPQQLNRLKTVFSPAPYGDFPTP